MSSRPSPQGLPPALALLLAGIAHVGLFALALELAPPAPSPRVARSATQVTELELELLEPVSTPKDDDAAQGSAGGAAASALAPARPAADHVRPRTAALGISAEQMGAEAASEAPAPSEPLPAAGAPARPIDLGLNGGVARAAVSEGWLEPAPAPAAPSPGGLVEGLAALDAERGLARSSGATHAAFNAARRAAPAQGMGVFDILTNEHGVVLSVTLVSAGDNPDSWRRVGEELQGLLRDRPLRVAPGAKGLLARLRIEMGALAQDRSERGRTKRGAALGQGLSHPREQRDESTRASLEPGQLSPTLGVTLAGGGSGDRIRVVLLSETAL